MVFKKPFLPIVCVCVSGVCVYVCVSVLSCVQLFANPWTVAHQAPLSKEFNRQEYWSGLSFPSPIFILEDSNNFNQVS